MKQILVASTTKPEQAEENARLVSDVFSELAAFRTFQKNASERCRGRPAVTDITIVGSYGGVSNAV